MLAIQKRARLLSFVLGNAKGGIVKKFEDERAQPGFLTRHLALPNAKVIICNCTRKENPEILVAKGDGWADLSYALHSTSQLVPAAEEEVMFLGEDSEGRSVFAASQTALRPEALSGSQWVPARQLMNRDCSVVLNTVGTAIAMIQWRSSNRFCSYCGAQILSSYFSHDRFQCGICKKIVFPTVGSGVIIAVLDGKGNVLLCQNRNRPKDFDGKTLRTILAGFVSPGESLEEAVYRETLEESKAELIDITYAGSQPWPFPLPMNMSCYYGLADSSKPIEAEKKELLSVHWVSREDVQRSFSGAHPDFALPPLYTASYTLLKAWADGKVSNEGKFVE